MDLAVIYEGVPASPGYGTGAPEEHCPRKSPTDESLCGNPGFQWRSSSTLLEGEKKIRDQMHGRGYEEYLAFTRISPPPKVAQLRVKRDLLSL